MIGSTTQPRNAAPSRTRAAHSITYWVSVLLLSVAVPGTALGGQPWGTLLGTWEGVACYSNGDRGFCGGAECRNYHDGTYVGQKWQCVELCRRFWLIRLGVYIDPVSTGMSDAQTWYSRAEANGYACVANDGTSHPAPRDILCLVSDDGSLGHIGIVRGVTSDAVLVFHQNVTQGYADTCYAFAVTNGVVSGMNAYGKRLRCVGWIKAPAGSPNVRVDRLRAALGESVTASWQGFAGSVNLEVWKGTGRWVYANTNLAGDRGNQVLGTTGWELRDDYRAVVTLRSDTTVRAFSAPFAVYGETAGTVTITPSSVARGGSVTASWEGFPDNVNIEVWKGDRRWVYANTNVSGESGSQVLETTGWEPREDYRVVGTLRADTTVRAFSDCFAVIDNTPGTVGVTPDAVSVGEPVELSWDSWPGAVNLELWAGPDFRMHANTNVAGSGNQTLETIDWAPNLYRVRVVLRRDTAIAAFSDWFVVARPPDPPVTCAGPYPGRTLPALLRRTADGRFRVSSRTGGTVVLALHTIDGRLVYRARRPGGTAVFAVPPTAAGAMAIATVLIDGRVRVRTRLPAAH